VLRRLNAILLVFGHSTWPRLPGGLQGTSQLECFPRVSLLHGGHSWKQQRPFKDKPHDGDDMNSATYILIEEFSSINFTYM